jgi:hypothetical protein
VFDYINIKSLKNALDVLLSDFNNLINYNNLTKYTVKETGEIKTRNVLYDNNDKDITFPHHNMFNEKIYSDFRLKIERFRKTKYFNTLFVFTITNNKHTYDEIIYYSNQLKIFFDSNGYSYSLLIIDISPDDAENNRCKLLFNSGNIFIYKLIIHNKSYTGGAFANDIDNDNYINIIKLFIKENDVFVNKDEIDNITYTNT